ncbi:MFS transporter [Natrinema halophilum]|uniref:MFS transporter n=1 Tax=Natrinema halophilum TaxID=1699371 RepID=A0A7D5GPX8_9EURY|nr:MFS transporter [Natrinema halophilum]QLG50873.1 MFS transporter [Natrinema halophilum]
MSARSRFADVTGLRGHLSAHDRHLLGYTTVAHALDHAVMLSIPLFVPIWIRQFDVGQTEIGLAVTVMAALFGVTAIPSGLLSDHLGADVLIPIFLGATGVALLLIRLVDGFLGLTAVLGLVGAAAGLYHPPALSLISREGDEPSKGFAYHGLGANLGIGLGPLVLTIGLTVVGWQTLLPLLAIPLIGFAFIFWWRGPDDYPEAAAYTVDGGIWQQLRSFLRVTFGLLVVMYVAAGLYYRGVLTFLPQFLDTVGTLPALDIAGATFEPGRWVYSAILLVGAVGQIAGGNLGERYGPEPVLLGVFVGTSAVLLALSALGGTTVLIAGFLFGTLLFTLPPLQSALVSKYVPDASQGLGYGLVFAINFGVGSLGASLAGTILEEGSFESLFQLFAVLPLFALIAVFALHRYSAILRS